MPAGKIAHTVNEARVQKMSQNERSVFEDNEIQATFLLYTVSCIERTRSTMNQCYGLNCGTSELFHRKQCWLLPRSQWKIAIVSVSLDI